MYIYTDYRKYLYNIECVVVVVVVCLREEGMYLKECLLTKRSL